jgi:acyl transferase domain-containing protein
MEQRPGAVVSVAESTGAVVDSSAIAIVGMACRLPGAANLSQLWPLLRDGVDATSAVPPDRGLGVARAGLVDHVDQFDAEFFQISRS